MEYVTVNQFDELIRHNLHRIPHDIDLVVGIPRSGMLPANLIALYLNTRLSDIDSFVGGRIYSNGLSRGGYVRKGEIKKVLVVDDSIGSGVSMNDAKKKLEVCRDGNYDFIFCAPIATTGGSKMVDLYFTIIDGDRLFEWNIFHHSILSIACMDIDGVLCVDPLLDDDGEVYQSFLQTANPLFVPTCKINTLISCRLEKYRNQTEKWLSDNHVDYDKLVMLDFPDKATRVAWGKHGEYKGKYYAQRQDCSLFIESSYAQAVEIAKISGKPVYCVESNSMIQIQVVSKKKRFLHAIRKRMPNVYSRIRKMYYRTK